MGWWGPGWRWASHWPLRPASLPRFVWCLLPPPGKSDPSWHLFVPEASVSEFILNQAGSSLQECCSREYMISPQDDPLIRFELKTDPLLGRDAAGPGVNPLRLSPPLRSLSLSPPRLWVSLSLVFLFTRMTCRLQRLSIRSWEETSLYSNKFIFLDPFRS